MRDATQQLEFEGTLDPLEERVGEKVREIHGRSHFHGCDHFLELIAEEISAFEGAARKQAVEPYMQGAFQRTNHVLLLREDLVAFARRDLGSSEPGRYRVSLEQGSILWTYTSHWGPGLCFGFPQKRVGEMIERLDPVQGQLVHVFQRLKGIQREAYRAIRLEVVRQSSDVEEGWVIIPSVVRKPSYIVGRYELRIEDGEVGVGLETLPGMEFRSLNSTLAALEAATFGHILLARGTEQYPFRQTTFPLVNTQLVTWAHSQNYVVAGGVPKKSKLLGIE